MIEVTAISKERKINL